MIETSEEKDNVQNIIKTKYNTISYIHDDVLYISISTQNGCPVNCYGCKLGNQFTTSLSSKEMIEQVDLVLESIKENGYTYKTVVVDNRSVGEPMLNFKEVETFINYCKNLDYTFNLYTVGADYSDILNRILNLSLRYTKFNLYINIISLEDVQRNLIIRNRNLAFMRLQKIVNYVNKYKHTTGKNVHIIYHPTGKENSLTFELFKNKFSQATLHISKKYFTLTNDEEYEKKGNEVHDKWVNNIKENIDTSIDIVLPTNVDYLIEPYIYR